MEIIDLLVISIAAFCSSVIKTGVGVGSGIFLLPTLALSFPAKIALGIGAPIMFVSDVLGMFYYWKEWANIDTLKRILGAAVPGLVIGVILIPIIPPSIFKFCVGIYGMLYAVSMLYPQFPITRFIKGCTQSLNDRFESKRIYIFGFLGGIATILAHAGGVVWSLYLHGALKEKRVFVGTIVLMFFLTNFFKTGAFLYVGVLPFEYLIYVLYSVPCIFLGSYVGNFINKKMTGNLFKNIVLVFIFIVSLNLCF